MTTFNQLTPQQVAYIAGFLDGDGCVNAQLVTREDYILGFQIRVTVTFYQKTKRHWFLVWLQKKLNCGKIRKRPDGMSELTLVGVQTVQPFLQKIVQYLLVKRKQASLVLYICHNLSKKQSPEDFVRLCEKVDLIETLNDSKKRSIKAKDVKKHLGVDN
uniref:Putative site-specific DNA endonuclease n=1 Tax=Dicloster acuatus TaxID=91190 RepID=A0A097KQM3_9CHLO|nr:putative site-specific DNA endonuclease [Dicloster acuatus]YP_009106654.1 putative site-specific DNA endonuclease [Dicloster acuatus]AIT95467.1 putative site-specific DNA endonuclease [Dicloster acuatus]AIT95468.1 putative site-specific DNA endonuclease [Dicloster acuatus]